MDSLLTRGMSWSAVSAAVAAPAAASRSVSGVGDRSQPARPITAAVMLSARSARTGFIGKDSVCLERVHRAEFRRLERGGARCKRAGGGPVPGALAGDSSRIRAYAVLRHFSVDGETRGSIRNPRQDSFRNRRQISQDEGGMLRRSTGKQGDRT